MNQHNPLPVTIYTPESAIASPGRMLRDMAHDLRMSRELSWRLAVRDISAQYRQTMLGFLWALVLPLANTAVWVFLSASGILAVGTTDLPYPAFVLIGTMLWAIFMEAVTAPMQGVTAARDMLAKINFPREAIVIAGIYQVLFNAAIKLSILFVALFIFGIIPDWKAVLVPFGGRGHDGEVAARRGRGATGDGLHHDLELREPDGGHGLSLPVREPALLLALPDSKLFGGVRVGCGVHVGEVMRGAEEQQVLVAVPLRVGHRRVVSSRARVQPRDVRDVSDDDVRTIDAIGQRGEAAWKCAESGSVEEQLEGLLAVVAAGHRGSVDGLGVGLTVARAHQRWPLVRSSRARRWRGVSRSCRVSGPARSQ